jgi:hypothetical protein
MHDFLQKLDRDYYRSAQLLVAHAELDHLRQEVSAGIGSERRSETPFGVSPTADRTGPPEVACASPRYGDPGKVC